MNIIFKLICLLLFFTSFTVNAENTKCKSITLGENLLFVVTAYIKGPRGTLKFPAIIDTGATHTFIPRSIANGIGYEKQWKTIYSTANGMKSFNVIKVEKLSFLGATFNDVKVAITEPKKEKEIVKNPWLTKAFDNDNNLNKKIKENSNIELALIGMSELSNTIFNYDNKSLTVCSK